MSKKKGLFRGLFKNQVIKEVNESSECCVDTISIKVLGSGCKNCNILEENTRQALAKVGFKATVEKVTDLAKITEYGVLLTPALVIDEKVVASGKVLNPNEIVKILQTGR